MTKKRRIEKEDAVLVVIDLQEKLMPAIEDTSQLEATIVKLISGTKVLGIPTLVTQQYTKGLGETVNSIAGALGEYQPIDKFTFSSLQTEAFAEALKATGKKTVIICGVEAHICVQQTSLELLEAGYDVFVVADCVGSRQGSNCQIALNRMAQAGAVITTYESVLYELLRSAKAEGFKQISNIVK